MRLKGSLLLKMDNEKIFEGSVVKRFGAGEIIFQAGDTADEVYIIENGKVEIKYLDKNGKKLTLLVLGQGKIFGEMGCFFGNEIRRNMAIAMEDETKIRIISRNKFERLMNLNPFIQLLLLEELAKRAMEFEEKMEDLALRNIKTRLVHQILKLSEEYGEITDRGIELDLNLTHRELAEMICAARENVTLAISQLVKAGLIENPHHRIIIKDKKALSEI